MLLSTVFVSLLVAGSASANYGCRWIRHGMCSGDNTVSLRQT